VPCAANHTSVSAGDSRSEHVSRLVIIREIIATHDDKRWWHYFTKAHDGRRVYLYSRILILAMPTSVVRHYGKERFSALWP
jgi:hypothetical protein